MPNPFLVPSRQLRDTRPLDPVTHEEHAHFFAPLDGIPTALETGKQALTGSISQGGECRLVLATGDEGCGKTSVLHALQAFLRSICNQDSHLVVDLSRDPSGAIPAKDRLDRIAARTVQKLAISSALDEKQVSQIQADGSHTDLEILSDVLEATGRTVGITLPPLELALDLQLILQLNSPAVYFFAESMESRGVDLSGLPGGKIVTLPLSSLEVADGWRFVSDRLSRAPGSPAIDQTVVERYMQARLGGVGTSVRELQRTFEFVFQVAIDRSAGTVEYEDFAFYYTSHGRVQ